MTEAATPLTSAPDYAPMLAELKATFESERTMNLQWRARQLEARGCTSASICRALSARPPISLANQGAIRFRMARRE